MKIFRDENGQALVITALCMTILLGFAALSLDVGHLFNARRKVQTAADSAAIAGALALAYGGTTVTSAAQTAAGNNLISDPTHQVAVTTSPTDGWHTGLGYVEVVITQPNGTAFLGMFGHGITNVSARAVAGITPSPACIYLLDPTDADVMWIKGKAAVQAPGCGVQINSKSPKAYCDQGAATLDAPYLHIVGGQDTSGKCGKSHGPTVQSGVAPSPNPFANLPMPALTDCTGANTVGTTSVNSSTTILSSPKTDSSGGTSSLTCFPAGTTLTGPLTLGTTGGNSIFLFKSGVTLSGTITVNGTLDIYQGNFSQGNAQLSITAPVNSSGVNYTYNGIALIQAATDTTASSCDTSAPCLQMQFGSGNENLSGLIYAPTSEVVMQDEGGGVQASGIVAWQMYINSDFKLTDSYNEANPSSTPLSKISLVE